MQGGEKALPVILSVSTGRHCPFLIFRLKRRMSLSNTQPVQLGWLYSESIPFLSSSRILCVPSRKRPKSFPIRK
jgi:hypothetical protein